MALNLIVDPIFNENLKKLQWNKNAFLGTSPCLNLERW